MKLIILFKINLYPYNYMYQVKYIINALLISSGARKLRVWSRECEHDFTSENIDGVEHALCWK